MDPAPIRRWNPGFIALRWRHLFWVLPFAGLLIGLAVHVMDYQRRNVATSIVQLTPMLSSFGFSECFTLIKSDEILEATSQELGLPARWKMDNAQALDALRQLVECDQIPGTSLFTISIEGRKSPMTVELCTAVTRQTTNAVESITRKHNESVSQMGDAELDRRDLRVAALQRDLELLRFPQTRIESERSADPRVEAAQRNLAAARKDRHDFLVALLSNRYPTGLRILNYSPLTVHEFPSMTAPAVPIGERLLPPALACSIGVGSGSGMVLAVILAYLLELLFPRKRAEENAFSARTSS